MRLPVPFYKSATQNGASACNRLSSGFLLFVALLFHAVDIHAQCPQVEAIMVDACGPEQLNEFIIIRSGAGLNTSDIQLDYDLNTNIIGPENNDINTNNGNWPADPTPCGLATGNTAAFTGCSNLIAVGPGVDIPANAILVLQTSAGPTNALYNFASLCGSGQCVYVIASTCSRSLGAFSNSGTGTRTTVFSIAGTCTQAITYDRASLSNANGDYYMPLSNTYGNAGCVAPPMVPSATDIWTGCLSSDWATAGNWLDGSVPTATDDVTIPDVTNNPVVMAGTAAVAKSVTINANASLTVEAMGSLTINGFANNPNDFTTAGMHNSGTVTNNGVITLGSTASVSNHAIYNNGTVFNNAGAEMHLDRADKNGIENNGSFTNAGDITIGAIDLGQFGILNKGTFDNATGAEIAIDRSDDTGLRNASGTFTNSGKITLGASASVGTNGLINFAVFNNQAGGEIHLDNSFKVGLYNSGTFTNEAKIKIGQMVSPGDYGLWQQSHSAMFHNNAGGEIYIDRAGDIGLHNQFGTFNNAAKIVIGAVAGVGFDGIYNSATLNNTPCTALIHIVSDNVITNTGTFTNAGVIIENASGSSSITTNTGVVQNLNGGIFTTGGTPATTFAGHLSACCPAANILYVNDNAAGANDGTSWADAYTDLQSALNSPCPGITQIWVAEGTYKPTSGTDRTNSFVMKNGVEILGGFPNTGDPGLGDRNPDPATNGTVLSGDIGGAGNGDNSYHVIFNNFSSGSPLTGTAVLDGFTVTGGYASDVAPHCHGGGMYNLYASPTVTNCIFFNNTARRSAATSFDSRGGGMYNSYSAPSVSYCTFSNNEARAVNSSGTSRGGGMFNEHATMTISHCTFSNNTTPNSDEDTYGGGMCNLNMTIEITDCAFSGNAACFGGGVYHEASAITVKNCTFSGNSLDTYPGGVNGSGMYISGSSGSVSHCNFTGNLNHAALGIQYGTPIEVDHCTFLNNPVYGMTLQSAEPILTNCLFAGNDFGGLANWPGGNSSPTLTNCTFSENPVFANLGAITNYGTSTATLKNCILWDDGPSVYNPSGTVNISYSIVKQPAGVYPGTGNLNADPLFVGATDFHLQACSPAIDAGTDAGAPDDDLDGDARPFDAAPNVTGNFDMGAYEYQELLPAPTATCQDITVQLDGNGSVTVLAGDVNDNSTGGCGALAFLINGETSLAFDCDDLGGQTVTLTVTDAFGNTADCEATITVADDDNPCCAAPEAICKPYTAVLGPGGIATVAPANVDDGSTAECGLQDMTVSPDQFDCSDLGPQTVTLTVTDINGASDQCMATVTVVDNSLPGITCPGPVTVTCAGNVPPVSLAAVTASDNCGAPTKSHVGDATSNVSCTNRKTVTRTYRATDGSGNSTTCAQVITVYDNVKPNFTSVPANVTVQCNSVPAVGTATATDGCGGSVTIAYNGQTSVPGACPDAYTITRQWTATDLCGNTKTATQRITVVDTQKPNFTGTPANITVQCSAIPDPAAPAATDNCDNVVAITYNGQTQTNGACANAYTLTRRWTAEDNCGNTRSISQRITVVDNGKPVFTSFPENTTIACDETPPAVGSPTASDGCGNATVTFLGQSTTSGSCPGNYQIKRTWRAADACGNSTAATQTIQVSDGGAPVFTSVPGPLTIECGDPLPPLANPTASDACGGYAHITFLGNAPSGSGCAADYTVTRTWQAADLCGNTTTTTQVITVLGNAGFSPPPYGENRSAQSNAPVDQRAEARYSLSLQPNPTKDRIQLDLTDFAGEVVTVSIFGDLGQLVWERRISVVKELKFSISLREAGAAAGMYTVRVRSASGVVAKRVLLVE